MTISQCPFVWFGPCFRLNDEIVLHLCVYCHCPTAEVMLSKPSCEAPWSSQELSASQMGEAWLLKGLILCVLFFSLHPWLNVHFLRLQHLLQHQSLSWELLQRNRVVQPDAPKENLAKPLRSLHQPHLSHLQLLPGMRSGSPNKPADLFLAQTQMDAFLLSKKEIKSNVFRVKQSAKKYNLNHCKRNLKPITKLKVVWTARKQSILIINCNGINYQTS